MNLVDKVFTEIKEETYKTASYIVFRGERVSLAKVNKGEILNALPSLESSISDELQKDLKNLSRGELLDFSISLGQKIQPKKTKKVELPKEIEEGLKACVLIDIEEGYVFFNAATRSILETSAEMLLRRFSTKDRAERIQDARIGRAIFDAHDIRPIRSEVVDSFIETAVMNLYKPPVWREKHPKPDPIWKGELPPLMEQLIDGLCANKESKEALLLWVAQAVVSKNETFLQLRGRRGNGKTTLAYLLMAVIGNGVKARQGVNPDGFNGYLRGKRSVLIDDDKDFGSIKYNIKRKDLLNEKQTYNIKGVQVGDSERQFTNFIVASNLADHFYVDYDERRMTYIDLTYQELDEYMDRDTSAILRNIGAVEDHTDSQLEFIAQAGHYFLQYAKDNKDRLTNMSDRKNDTFWDDVVSSLGEVKRTLIDRVLEGNQEIISFASLKAESDSRVRYKTIKDFSRAFNYKGNKLFTDIDDKQRNFRVNPIFLNTKPTETFDEDFEIENL